MTVINDIRAGVAIVFIVIFLAIAAGCFAYILLEVWREIRERWLWMV